MAVSRAVGLLKKQALYIDRGLLVVNKPAGMVCQFNKSDRSKAEDDEFRRFIEELREHFDLADDLYPVHRLDKDTTGSLALALSSSHARSLTQQFEARTVEKAYLALVRGGEQSFPERSGTIRGGLTYVNGRPVSGNVGSNNKSGEVVRKVAETDWEVLASSPLAPLSLLRLRPYTGYKHQLRVQMAQKLKTPILGDSQYSRSVLSPKIAEVVNVPPGHLYLHSSQLSFFRYRQAGENKQIRVTIGAPLPGSFTRLCAKLKIPLHGDLVRGGLWVDGERAPPQPRHSTPPKEVGREGAPENSRGNWVDEASYKLEGVQGRWVGS